MNITVAGCGYVGLVTGVCLADIGHNVKCVDIDSRKIDLLNSGTSPIYEPGLEELMDKNKKKGRLMFTEDRKDSYADADVIIIAVGTPSNEDGSANLEYVFQTAMDVARNIKRDSIVVIKSTVPVGTNQKVKTFIEKHLSRQITVEVASNPEFLREGSAIHDTFFADRIIVGAENQKTADKIAEIYNHFEVPIFKTDICTAEMIKYASNAFLATKISFINEISNICEKVGANVEDVAIGMGYDKRIGPAFLNAGIGYGGSCFPKDTKALVQIATDVKYHFNLLKSVILVNNNQQKRLVEKVKSKFNNELTNKNIALFGLSFKPNTDDMREAPSIVISQELIRLGANVIAYDPISMENARNFLPSEVIYVNKKEEALIGADAVLILTEWDEFKSIDLHLFVKLMNNPIIFDGRNCYQISEISKFDVEYHSIGRPSVHSTRESILIFER